MIGSQYEFDILFIAAVKDAKKYLQYRRDTPKKIINVENKIRNLYPTIAEYDREMKEKNIQYIVKIANRQLDDELLV